MVILGEYLLDCGRLILERIPVICKICENAGSPFGTFLVKHLDLVLSFRVLLSSSFEKVFRELEVALQLSSTHSNARNMLLPRGSWDVPLPASLAKYLDLLFACRNWFTRFF